MQTIHITFGDCFISGIRLSSECSEQLRFSDVFLVNWRRKLASFVLVALRVELNNFLTGQYLRTMFSLVSSIYTLYIYRVVLQVIYVEFHCLMCQKYVAA